MDEIDYDKYEYLHKAYEYWTNLKIRMHFRDGDSFVLIHNEDYEINEITLRLMDYYKNYKEIDNLYIITDIDQVEQYANTVIKNEFVYIKCSVEEAEMLCLLSWVVKGLTSGLTVLTVSFLAALELMLTLTLSVDLSSLLLLFSIILSE